MGHNNYQARQSFIPNKSRDIPLIERLIDEVNRFISIR